MHPAVTTKFVTEASTTFKDCEAEVVKLVSFRMERQLKARRDQCRHSWGTRLRLVGVLTPKTAT